MKANVIALDGKKKGSIELPPCFSAEHRPDLIKSAFLSDQSRGFQPKGADPRAGFRTSAANWGTGAGRSRLPRVKAGPKRSGRQAKGHRYRSKGRWFHAAGRGAVVPQTRGGRQAHPPKPEKILIKNINEKEYARALESAISATTNKELVGKKHRIGEAEIPLIIESKFNTLKKTKEALDALTKAGLGNELERVSKKKIRSGRGTTRGRKYKKKKGPLVVMTAKGKSAARNIAGVDVTTAGELSVEMLAPGTEAGRLTVWTEDAIKELGKEEA